MNEPTSWTPETALLALREDGVQPGQRFRHFKGGLYEVTGTGVLERTCEPVVMYANVMGVTWVRYLGDFRGKVKQGEVYVDRFQPVAADEAVHLNPKDDHGVTPYEVARWLEALAAAADRNADSVVGKVRDHMASGACALRGAAGTLRSRYPQTFPQEG